MELAIWYHDAIYDPAARDNEARSAALLRAELTGLADPAMLDRAALLIRLTADHALPPGLDDDDAALLLDLDMAVLGASRAEYDAYERGIAAEYVPVHGAGPYRAGRAGFLQATLARPRLYHSDWFHQRLEAPARANLGRALLASGAGPA